MENPARVKEHHERAKQRKLVVRGTWHRGCDVGEGACKGEAPWNWYKGSARCKHPGVAVYVGPPVPERA